MATYKKGSKAAVSTTQWKSAEQQAMVIRRLQEVGIPVTEATPVSQCWNLLTTLLTDEVAGRRPSMSPNLPPLPKPKSRKGFVEWSPDD